MGMAGKLLTHSPELPSGLGALDWLESPGIPEWALQWHFPLYQRPGYWQHALIHVSGRVLLFGVVSAPAQGIGLHF